MLRFEIENVRNKILTHNGSIELQEQLEENPIFLSSIILQEIENNFTLICLDTYGNYVCQKIIPFLSNNQMFRLVSAAAQEFELMATSIPGSCILSVLAKFSLKDSSCKNILLEAMEKSVIKIICDPQGSHLLQLALNLYEENDVKFIIETAIENYFIISTDRFGCCIIKKIIETSSTKYTDKIFSQVCSNLITLSNVNNNNNVTYGFIILYSI